MDKRYFSFFRDEEKMVRNIEYFFDKGWCVADVSYSKIAKVVAKMNRYHKETGIRPTFFRSKDLSYILFPPEHSKRDINKSRSCGFNVRESTDRYSEYSDEDFTSFWKSLIALRKEGWCLTEASDKGDEQIKRMGLDSSVVNYFSNSIDDFLGYFKSEENEE
jgi:hypothetical protein